MSLARLAVAGFIASMNSTYQPLDSCGCWRFPSRNFVWIDVGSPQLVGGIEAHGIDTVYWGGWSVDNVTWHDYTCNSTLCLFPGLYMARWARIGVEGFMGESNVAQVAGAVLGYRVLWGFGGRGDTAGVLMINATNLTLSLYSGGSPVEQLVYQNPGCGAADVSNAARWLGGALELYGVEARLEALVRRRCVRGTWIVPLVPRVPVVLG